uniref:Cell death inducing DFFA like effector c n=2 Tax=Leptobrachium leishanense TaxID=445787 RepID=A0A8C5QZI5_9ANUR
MAFETDQVIITRMEYAAKSLSFLSPTSLSKCVSVSATMTQQLLSRPPPKPRPFRVCNFDHSTRKGIMANSLADLINKVQDSLLMTEAFTLVLDEDGTCVDTEEFFQTVEKGTVFMALGKGQTWKPVEGKGYPISLSKNPPGRNDVASITFDLYKNHPEDFIGCLNVKATFYGAYTVSYNLECYGAKRIMTEALRWTLFTMQATGHVLLGTSGYMQQLLDATEKTIPVEEKPASGRRNLISSSPLRMLQ